MMPKPQSMLFTEKFSVFLEDVIEPYKRSVVAQELAELYGINEEKFERLLSKYKKPTTKPISYQEAFKLQWYLKKLSVQTRLVTEEDLQALSESLVKTTTKQSQREVPITSSVPPLYEASKDEPAFKTPVLVLLYICLYGCLLFSLTYALSLFAVVPTPQAYTPYLNVDLSNYKGQNLVLGTSLVIIFLWLLGMLVPVHTSTTWFISLIKQLRLPMTIVFMLLICVELASLMGVFG